MANSYFSFVSHIANGYGMHLLVVSAPTIFLISFELLCPFCSNDVVMFQLQAQKAERDATDLKGSMRKRMEFLDLD